MKGKSVDDFLAQLDVDTDLQDKVKECVLAEQHIAAMAKLLGYEFTPAELDRALAEKWKLAGCESMLFRVTFSESPGF